MIMTQYMPKWLRLRLQKPRQPRPAIVRKKDRQVLPTMHKQSRPADYSRNEIPPGERLLWRI
jgi:hypothetical protein